MSQHAIEDLIETGIRQVDAGNDTPARKAALIAGLLVLQARYDTSLTWFRLPDILLAHGVLLRQPLAAIADAATRAAVLAATPPGWASDANGDALGYVQHESGDAVLYRVNDALPTVPLPELFLAMLQHAAASHDNNLLTDWYGLLVNGWLQGELAGDAGFPPTLAGLAEVPALCAARVIAAEHAIKPRRGADEDLALPRLAAALESAGSDLEFGVRFFLEPRKSIEALGKAQVKAIARQHASAVLIPELIQTRLGQCLQQAGWQALADVPAGDWRWVRDVEGDRQMVWCQFTEFDARMGMLICMMGLQHRLLRHWQQAAPAHEPHELHFYQVATATFPDVVREGPQVNGFGAWKLDPGKPAKVLTASLQTLAEHLPAALEVWFTRAAAWFPAQCFARDADEWLDLLRNGVDGSGVVPDDLLFASPDSLLLAFVFHHRDNGDEAAVAALVEHLRQREAARTRTGTWSRQYLIPFLEGWAAGGRDLPMPPALHGELARHLG